MFALGLLCLIPFQIKSPFRYIRWHASTFPQGWIQSEIRQVLSTLYQNKQPGSWGQPVQAISPRLFFCGCCGRMALILFRPYMKWTWKYICWSAGVQAGCRVFSASMCPIRGTHSGKQQKSGSTCEQCQGTQPWPTHIKRMLARQEFYLPRSRMILVHRAFATWKAKAFQESADNK